MQRILTDYESVVSGEKERIVNHEIHERHEKKMIVFFGVFGMVRG